MRVFLVFLLAAGQFLLVRPGWSAPDAFEQIIGRQRSLLLEKAPSTPPATIQQWVRQLDPQGAWPDINYQDQASADWSPRYHLDRVVALCKASLQPQSPLRGDPAVASAIDRALDYWIATRPRCRNWWHNDIGTPGFMRDIIFLLGDRLTGARRAGTMEVLHQYKVGGEGANLVWTATLALSYGCLTKDDALVADSAGRLEREIHVSKGEGIQPDFSFHQHGKRLQAFHYGGAYLHDLSRVAWMLAGTRWAVPPGKIRLLVDYVLKGQQWMGRWDHTVPGTLDRAISRPDATNITDLDGNAALLAELSPADRPALAEIRARIERHAPPLSGFRAFPYSDFACYHRPEFSFFVKTISTRTQPTEGGMNGENVKGWHLNAGDTYILRRGDEYENLPPVWDWSLLPGTTGIEGLHQVDRQSFVGAVSDGQSGCSAMDYAVSEANGDGRLRARKAYFCHGDAVVCLIGGLSAKAGDRPARTALDQRLLRGEVVAGGQDGQAHVLPVGKSQLTSARWLYHDGLVYVPTLPQNLTVLMGPVTGTWRAINSSGSSNPVEKSVFLPFLTHGTDLDQASAGYAILACENASLAASRAQSPGYRLLRNDAECQAVRWSDGALMTVFYAPGGLRDGDQQILSVDQPCMLLWVSGHFFASDPSERGIPMRIGLNGQPPITVALPADGTTVEAH